MSAEPVSGGAKVVLVGQNGDFIDALGAWLEAEIVGLRVVALARSVVEAVDQAALHLPDLVIADWSLPDGSGSEIVRRVLAVAPAAAFWVLTIDERDDLAGMIRVVGPVRRIPGGEVTKKLLPAVRALLAVHPNGPDSLPGRVFVIDDDDSVCRALARLLCSAGFRVETFNSAPEFLKSSPPGADDCLLIDVDMPGMSGPELRDVLRAAGCLSKVIFITGRERQDLGREAVLFKPIDPDALVSAVDAAIRTGLRWRTRSRRSLRR